jgi:hypothetical protein
MTTASKSFNRIRTRKALIYCQIIPACKMFYIFCRNAETIKAKKRKFVSVKRHLSERIRLINHKLTEYELNEFDKRLTPDSMPLLSETDRIGCRSHLTSWSG